jgi:hypothetical protein
VETQKVHSNLARVRPFLSNTYILVNFNLTLDPNQTLTLLGLLTPFSHNGRPNRQPPRLHPYLPYTPLSLPQYRFNEISGRQRHDETAAVMRQPTPVLLYALRTVHYDIDGLTTGYANDLLGFLARNRNTQRYINHPS